MVELARARGVDALVADVQQIPFRDAEFDAVVAAWMLYHVPDLERGLSEVARVLRPGGALVAVTNGARDLHEVWDLVGRDLGPRLATFRTENGATYLERHFESVRRVDLVGSVTFPDADAIRRYVGSSALGRDHVDCILGSVPPLVATKVVGVFIATTASR
jgi:SAM-dependent methyltransferase